MKTPFILRLSLLALLALLGSNPAAAHSLSVAHVDIDSRDGRQNLRVDLDIPLRDVALSLALDANGDGALTWGEVRAQNAALQAMAAGALRLSDETGPCALRADRLGLRRYDDGTYVALALTAACPGEGELRLDYSLMFASDPQHRALVTWRDADGIETRIATTQARRVVFASEHGNAGGTFTAFLREGVTHILSGYDHLAFLATLLLPAVLVRGAGRWSHAEHARDGLRQAFATITAFTAAHSITLGMAALGLLRPAAAWIEPLIALSVAFAAAHNLRPLLHDRLWVMAFAFGLIHGFGFGGALQEIGLPQNDRVLALAGFNLGVEFGQLAVAGAVFPLLLLVRDRAWYSRWLMPGASLAILGIACAWAYERLA